MTVFKSDAAKPILLSEKDWFDVDVISCAAPNLRYMSQHDKNWKKNVTDKKLFDTYKKRINRVLDIASCAKSDVIILGAFGCGAFANPPELVGLGCALIIVWVAFIIITMLYMTSIGKEAYELIQNNDIIKMIYDYNPIMQLAVKF